MNTRINVMEGKMFDVIDGCELSLVDGRIVQGEPTEKFVAMDCAMAMHLQNNGILCSYVREQPIFYGRRK